jgi:ATP-dependent DNA ligase
LAWERPAGPSRESLCHCASGRASCSAVQREREIKGRLAARSGPRLACREGSTDTSSRTGPAPTVAVASERRIKGALVCYQQHMYRVSAGFVAPCLPTKAPHPPTGEAWLHEIKHDGFRVIARKVGCRVKLYSRPGNDFTYRFPLIVEIHSMSPREAASASCKRPDPPALIVRRAGT